MSSPAYCKMTCRNCGGHVEFSEENQGATVPCQHCGRDLLLYSGIRATGTPPAIENPAGIETIFCSNCGEKNLQNNFKCVRCGSPLRRAPANQPNVVASGITYDVMVDKVGFVPNVRKKDNVFQAVFSIAATVLGTIIGLVWQGGMGAALGALVGLVVGGIISGLILCAVGLKRK